MTGYIDDIQELSNKATQGMHQVIENKLVIGNQLSDTVKQEIKEAIGDILNTSSVNEDQSNEINSEVDKLLNKHGGAPNSKDNSKGK